MRTLFAYPETWREGTAIVPAAAEDNCESVPLWRQAVVLAVPVALGLTEIIQWASWGEQDRTIGNLLLATQTGFYLVWLALFPLALLLGKWRIGVRLGRSGGSFSPRSRAAFCFVCCTIVAMLLAAGFGWRVKDLPYAYHDEYSYLFQAQTFLAGRFCFEPSPLAKFFEQVHVLSTPVFASRYFPGTGVWLAPFVAAGLPVAASWVCHGLVTGFSALAARQFSPQAGWIAGLLVGCSPAMLMLANLLLSPMPTMLGMAVFYWAFFWLMERQQWRWAALAGLAVGFAFLCRPLTAAGLGYPFALYALYRLQHAPERSDDRRSYATCLAVLILSFGLCVAAMAGFNAALTGSPLTSPYGLYTARHTPSHVYGFYNKQRGQAQRTDDTHLAYDEWSEDLDWPRAVDLVAERVWGLISWSLGVIAVSTLGVLLLLVAPQWKDRLLLLILAVVGLVLAYMPYGHTGMFGWGYLFEATPPLLMCLAAVTARLSDDWQRRGRPMVGTWWQGVWLVAVGVNLTQSVPAAFAPGSELIHPRRVASLQSEKERAVAARRPILVIIQADPKQSLHSTYVHNRPTLDGPILRAWYRGDETQQLLDAFPDRAVYGYRPATDDWQLYRLPTSNE